jgi:hypothetical protein
MLLRSTFADERVHVVLGGVRPTTDTVSSLHGSQFTFYRRVATVAPLVVTPVQHNLQIKRHQDEPEQ